MTTDSGLSHEFQGRVAIHNNGAGDVPGTKLCDLQGLSDYETGLSLSNGDWPDRLYAPEYADNTLAASTTYWVLQRRPTGSRINCESYDGRKSSCWTRYCYAAWR